MKRILFAILLAGGVCMMLPAAAGAESYVDMLRAARTNDQIIEALYQLSYYGNRSCFWDFVKYLNYTSGESEGSNAPVVRKAAAEALGRTKDERAIAHLVERYGKEKNDSVKISIVFALSFLPSSDTVKVIQDALGSQNVDVRYEALVSAVRVNAKDALPAVKGIFPSEKDDTVKMASAYALYSLGDDQEALKFLIAGLHSSDPVIRFRAADFIGRAGIDVAAPDVIKAMEIENRGWVQIELYRTMDRIYDVRKKKREADAAEGYKFLDKQADDAPKAPAMPAEQTK